MWFKWNVFTYGLSGNNRPSLIWEARWPVKSQECSSCGNYKIFQPWSETDCDKDGFSFCSMKSSKIAVSSFSSEPMTLASNCGAAIPTTSTSVKPKKVLRWMAQSVHQERWGMSQSQTWFNGFFGCFFSFSCHCQYLLKFFCLFPLVLIIVTIVVLQGPLHLEVQPATSGPRWELGFVVKVWLLLQNMWRWSSLSQPTVQQPSVSSEAAGRLSAAEWFTRSLCSSNRWWHSVKG